MLINKQKKLGAVQLLLALREVRAGAEKCRLTGR